MSTITTCYGDIDTAIMARLAKIKLLAFDVDGTITEGGVYLDNTELEFKKFYTKDGYGLHYLNKSGVICAAITGRKARLMERRMAELKLNHLIQGEWDKETALTNLCKQLNIDLDEAACIGDDLNDLPMFKIAGVTACPHDAHPYMQKIATLVMDYDGGKGAVRQFCDLIMMAQGKLNYDGGPLE